MAVVRHGLIETDAAGFKEISGLLKLLADAYAASLVGLRLPHVEPTRLRFGRDGRLAFCGSGRGSLEQSSPVSQEGSLVTVHSCRKKRGDELKSYKMCLIAKNRLNTIFGV